MDMDRARILLVDDDEAILKVYRRVLAEVDADLDWTTDPAQALEWAAEHAYCLIVLDVMMDQMDGYELAARLLRLPHQQSSALIFISAMVPPDEQLMNGYQTGAIDFLAKPISRQLLVNKALFFIRDYQNRVALAERVRQLDWINASLKQARRQLASELDTLRDRHFSAVERLSADALKRSDMLQTQAAAIQRSIQLSSEVESLRTELQGCRNALDRAYRQIYELLETPPSARPSDDTDFPRER